ncbi:hypothetical protein RFI_36676, partial [Reticulomyxa filosa]
MQFLFFKKLELSTTKLPQFKKTPTKKKTPESIPLHHLLKKPRTKRKKLSKMEEEKSKDKAKLNSKSITEQQACFDKNWILQLNQQEDIRDFICLICKQ